MSSFLRRLRNLLRGERLSADIDREMSFHLAERADELVATGMSPAAAREEAQRRFGNRTGLRERTRDADIVTWLASCAADVRYALRTMRGSPGFTAVAVLSLALGIGANTAIFSLVNAVLLRTLPVRDPASLVMVQSFRPSADQPGLRFSSYTNPLWEALRDRADGAGEFFAYDASEFDLADGGVRRRVTGMHLSGRAFEILGVRPVAGRLLAPSDDVRGCPATAVLSAGFAERQYGSADAAVGQRLSLDGHPFDVIGVAEPSFTGLEVGAAPAVFVPICAEAVTSPGASMLDHRSAWWLRIMGRLAPGQSLDEMRARLAVLAPQVYTAALPATWSAEQQQRFLKRDLWADPSSAGASRLRSTYGQALTVLLIVVGVVLLIACANVANLLLARATARQREMAVRLAMGAGRGRLVRQLLTESLMLAVSGALLGLLFARWAGALLVRFLSTRGETVWLDLAPDARVLGFTVGVALLTGVLFGLVPAIRATRVSPQAAMKAQGRGMTAARLPVARVLVIGQVALSLILVVAAALLVGSFRRIVTLDPGFRRDGVLLASAEYANAGMDSTRRRASRTQLLERLRALPGVQSAAVSMLSPVSGSGWNEEIAAGTDTVPRPPADGLPETLVWFNGVSPGWFATLGTPLRAGRDFDGGDAAGAAPVVIVNETMARRFFHGASPLGRTIRLRASNGAYGPPIEIVGVVGDAKYNELTEASPATAYLPIAQAQEFGTRWIFELRTSGDPMALAPQVTEAIAAESRGIAIDYVTLSEQVAESIRRPRLLATVSGFFGGLALLLAVIGLYGTMAYGVARRRAELGIRLALGAARSRVLGMVLSEAGLLIGAGAILGTLGALLATKLVATFLYGVARNDPPTLALSAGLLGIIALAAAAIPAWRAASVDPAETLRTD